MSKYVNEIILKNKKKRAQITPAETWSHEQLRALGEPTNIT